MILRVQVPVGVEVVLRFGNIACGRLATKSMRGPETVLEAMV